MAYTIERKVGLFFIVSLIILGSLLEIGEKWNPFEKKTTYKTFLSSVTGLKIGDPVRLAGVDVGRIKKIIVHDAKIEIIFEVKPDTRVKTDTVASLRLTNLLGGQFLSLSFGTPAAAILEAGGTVRGKDSANIDVIVDNVSDVIKDAKVMIVDLNRNQNEVMHKVSTILDDNRANLRDTVANARSISAKLDRGEGSLAMLLNDKTLYSDARNVFDNLKSVTGKISEGDGSIARFINDPALYSETREVIAKLKEGSGNINDTFAEFKNIGASINKGEGTIGKLFKDEAIYADLRDASKNINEITRKINNGEGTLGKLLNEDKLYRDTTATMKKVEKAAEGIGDSGPISILGSIIGTLF